MLYNINKRVIRLDFMAMNNDNNNNLDPEQMENERNNKEKVKYTEQENEFADGKGSRLDEQTKTAEESGESGDPKQDDADFESPKDDPA